MEATKLCVCKETAIRLRDKGYPQGNSYFQWLRSIKYDWHLENGYNHCRGKLNGDVISIDAPTTDELLNSPEIPDDTTITKHVDAIGTKYEVFSLSNNIDDIGEEILVEAVAEYWLKVKEIP